MWIAKPRTDRYRQAIKCALVAADELKHPTIEVTHLLCGLIREGTGVAYHVLSHLEFNFDNFSIVLSKVPQRQGIPGDCISDDAKVAVRNSVDWMRRFGHSHLGTEHLLLSLIENDTVSSTLMSCGVQSEDVRHEIHGLLGLLP